MGTGIYHNHQSQKGGIKEKMNTIRKLKKNAKALSPVVASIILIAVTVAVSIAVAAWMGALVVGQMATEELKISNVDFVTSPGDAILTVKNTGSTAVIISESYIGSTSIETDIGMSLAPNEAGEYTITPLTAFVEGQSYQFKLVTAKGTPFVYTATAPQ